jgi:hypothetical protein
LSSRLIAKIRTRPALSADWTAVSWLSGKVAVSWLSGKVKMTDIGCSWVTTTRPVASLGCTMLTWSTSRMPVRPVIGEVIVV